MKSVFLLFLFFPMTALTHEIKDPSKCEVQVGNQVKELERGWRGTEEVEAVKIVLTEDNEGGYADASYVQVQLIYADRETTYRVAYQPSENCEILRITRPQSPDDYIAPKATCRFMAENAIKALAKSEDIYVSTDDKYDTETVYGFRFKLGDGRGGSFTVLKNSCEIKSIFF